MPHAYVELHIEQGPILEREGVAIGAVTGVQGISWQELTITGRSSHAGTTPIALRHDPGLVAARIVAFARQLADDLGPPQVATVGRLELFPNLVNVVPAKATLTWAFGKHNTFPLDVTWDGITLTVRGEHNFVLKAVRA